MPDRPSPRDSVARWQTYADYLEAKVERLRAEVERMRLERIEVQARNCRRA